jgi:ACS family hexuronate transporter-like MFS transporter
MQRIIPFSDQIKAMFDSAFLIAYGLMYLGGGWLLDRLGTRRGFLLIMIFWSLASPARASRPTTDCPGFRDVVCAGHARGEPLSAGHGRGRRISRRRRASWRNGFRSTSVRPRWASSTPARPSARDCAPWLICLVLNYTGWFGSRRGAGCFFFPAPSACCGRSGGFAIIASASAPVRNERAIIAGGTPAASRISLGELLSHREVWAVVGAKFLSDGAWYFYMFWLPKFLMETFQIKFNAATGIGWIPYAASGVGCLVGGGFSSWLLKRGFSVNVSRKLALGASAALMPWVMLVPQLHSVGWVIFIFSLAFFGQQSWSTLVMILPTDMISKRAVGTLAGLVGFGGAMGGVLLGQIVGWLRDHGYSYTPALIISGSLHIIAFILICLVIPKFNRSKLSTNQ